MPIFLKVRKMNKPLRDITIADVAGMTSYDIISIVEEIHNATMRERRAIESTIAGYFQDIKEHTNP